ncbi:MAG: LysR family transcriptional regulator, partial [Mycobacterium leprae]
RGLGVAILSASMTSDRQDRLAAVPVDDLTTPAALALTWAPTDNPALQALLEHAYTAFAIVRGR